MKATHEEFCSDGFISFWLGNFASELDLDAYLSRGAQFEEDFGFKIYSPAGPEAYVSENGAKPIGDLLAGFSCSQTFISKAVEKANGQGWKEATTALVFYHLKYDSAFINDYTSGELSFVGVVDFPGFS